MFLKKIRKGKRIRAVIGMLLLMMVFQLSACGKKTEESQEASFYIPQVYRCSFVSLSEEDGHRNTFRHKMQYDLNDFYRHNDSYEAIFRLYRNASANSFLFEVVDGNFGIETLTSKDKDHFHYVVIDLCEEELFPGTEQMYQTMVYDVEAGNFWLGEDCDHLNAYGKCAIEGYSADTDLLAYVEGKWEVPEYQTFYEFLCSMDWLKNT
ncbi:MAG: hypothetical protein J6O61_15060 [Butyrivibrio sp.]|uniref:hypothetical protein n=1 Tax=Butyrivibrio sp. TaxID=28121 RepID=UPI001B2EDBBF|nr:hypothetical protein [Butyrivibrio sp.]MBO6242122.1 hypothetical protein [Butyrivibrio sp.]